MFLFSIIYGMSSFPLANIFQDGYCTTSQIPVGRWWQLVTWSYYFILLHTPRMVFRKIHQLNTWVFSVFFDPLMLRWCVGFPWNGWPEPVYPHGLHIPSDAHFKNGRFHPEHSRIWSCPKLGGILKRSKSLDCNIQSHWFWEFPILRSPFRFPCFFTAAFPRILMFAHTLGGERHLYCRTSVTGDRPIHGNPLDVS